MSRPDAGEVFLPREEYMRRGWKARGTRRAGRAAHTQRGHGSDLLQECGGPAFQGAAWRKGLFSGAPPRALAAALR